MPVDSVSGLTGEGQGESVRAMLFPERGKPDTWSVLEKL
jgi:hypothetical protein